MKFEVEAYSAVDGSRSLGIFDTFGEATTFVFSNFDRFSAKVLPTGPYRMLLSPLHGDDYISENPSKPDKIGLVLSVRVEVKE